MSEVMEAEVIEPANELDVVIGEPSITDNITALSAYVDKAIEPYIGWEVDVSDRKRITEAKKVIAELPKLKKRIDAERIRVKKAYTAPLEAWEKRVYEVTNKIEAAYRGVKDQIDDAEQSARDSRRERLEEVYGEFAPALVPMVSFDAILDKKWLNISMNEKRAENELCDKVARIAKEWETLKAANLRCKQETEAEYFRTLDLNAALAFDTEHAEELERLKALKAEVEPEPISEPIQEPARNPLSSDESIYRFTIEIPQTEFFTSINEATALKNHLKQLGIQARMTKSTAEVAA